MQAAPYDALGRPLPRVDLDHVHVYSQSLQMSLSPTEAEMEQLAATRPLGETSGSSSQAGFMSQPLSPGPPLRGYAAKPIGHHSPVGRRSPDPGSPQAKEQQQRETDYQNMMQGILERTRQQNQQQEQDEDRRVERLLKYMAQEQTFVDQLDDKLALREEAKFRRQQELAREAGGEGGVDEEDDELIPKIVAQVVVPKVAKVLEHAWDAGSTSSTTHAVGLVQDVVVYVLDSAPDSVKSLCATICGKLAAELARLATALGPARERDDTREGHALLLGQWAFSQCCKVVRRVSVGMHAHSVYMQTCICKYVCNPIPVPMPRVRGHACTQYIYANMYMQIYMQTYAYTSCPRACMHTVCAAVLRAVCLPYTSVHTRGLTCSRARNHVVGAPARTWMHARTARSHTMRTDRHARMHARTHARARAVARDDVRSRP